MMVHMTAYILGAGASADAGYPLASQLLQALSEWLDKKSNTEHWVPTCRNRILQVRETFGSLDDFEAILGELEGFGYNRIKPEGPTTYRQDHKDIFHDCTERKRGNGGDADTPASGFYPQYLRSDLIMAFREYFYEIESARTSEIAYDRFADRIAADDLVITLNYDIALERALAKAGKWDIRTGYGFAAFGRHPPSMTKIYKLHGSVNWFQAPMQGAPPPLMFPRDLKLLGCEDLVDARIGPTGVGINNSGTFVLPDPRKKFYWDQFWKPLWGEAARRLGQADEVFIHGYSMPAADEKARALLFGSIKRNVPVNIHCRSTSDRLSPRVFRPRLREGEFISYHRIRNMGKLSARQIDEYFAIHLPYRTRILVAHYLMTRQPWHGDRAQLEAAFEASLITGRMYLNVLGVSKNKHDVLVPFRPKDDDVNATDLGGISIDIAALTADDVTLLTGFLKMADKGAAHLTLPMPHPVEQTHIAIIRICELVKAHLYDATGRAFEVSITRAVPAVP